MSPCWYPFLCEMHSKFSSRKKNTLPWTTLYQSHQYKKKKFLTNVNYNRKRNPVQLERFDNATNMIIREVQMQNVKLLNKISDLQKEFIQMKNKMKSDDKEVKTDQ